MANVRSRGWCFTYFPVEGEGPELYDNLECEYIIVGDEVCPDTGRAHHQGYFYRKNPISFSSAKKKLPEGAHISKANGNPEQNERYCGKEKLLLSRGECPRQGQRTDIEEVREALEGGATMRDLCDTARSFQALRGAELILKYKEPQRTEPPEVYWFWGDTGTGKTREAFELAPGAWMSGKNLRWWDGYDAHQDVIFDDFRGDFCTYHELLRILDRYPYRVEVKGGSRQFVAKRIFITCPFPPERVYQTVEDKQQLIRRITEVRRFHKSDTEVLTQKSGGNTNPRVPIDNVELLSEKEMLELFT